MRYNTIKYIVENVSFKHIHIIYFLIDSSTASSTGKWYHKSRSRVSVHCIRNKYSKYSFHGYQSHVYNDFSQLDTYHTCS